MDTMPLSCTRIWQVLYIIVQRKGKPGRLYRFIFLYKRISPASRDGGERRQNACYEQISL